ncbi:MAG: apolipoprotein N-acyltransferase, partial [Elusimicrobiota bacterium]
GAYLRVPPSAGLGAFLLVCCYHGLMFAVLAGVSRAGGLFLSRRLGCTEGAALLLTAMPAAAAVENLFPMVFPVYFANTQYFHLPAVQILEFTGPAGLAWLLTGFNASLYLLAAALARRGGVPPASRAAAVFAGFLLIAGANEGFGRRRMAGVDAAVRERLSAGRTLKVSILQGSAPVDNAPGELNAPGLEIYRRLAGEAARQDAPALVVWPESVYGRRVIYRAGGERGGAEFAGDFGGLFSGDIGPGVSMLLGSEGQGQAGARAGGPVYNVAFTVDADRRLLGLLRKRHLFPFGEFMPFGDRLPWLYRLIPGVGRLSPGGEPEPLPAGGARAGVLICYEDLYTAAPRAFAAKGADFLVNMTNELRFGYSVAPRQHLWFGALRAIENRKFLLRAVNTGVSAVIDPCGRRVASLGVKERGRLTREIPLMPGPTFYSRHGRLLGHSGLLALAGLLLIVFLIPRRDPA